MGAAIMGLEEAERVAMEEDVREGAKPMASRVAMRPTRMEASFMIDEDEDGE